MKVSDNIVIIGGGPTGLSTAGYLNNLGYKNVVVLEKEGKVGGCHAVFNTPVFSEHSPKMYNTGYTTYFEFLKMLNYKWEELYIPYHWTVTNYSQAFSATDILLLLYYFIKDPNKRLSEVFPKDPRIERITRLTEGKGPEHWSVFRLLQLFYYNFNQRLLQPNTDVMMYLSIRLQSRGVTILTNQKKILFDYTNNYVITDSKNIKYDHLIFAVPLHQLPNELTSHFPKEFLQNSKYDEYPSFTLIYNDTISLHRQKVFSDSKIGLAFVITSDYKTNTNDKTIISCICTQPGDYSINELISIANDEVATSLRITKPFDTVEICPGKYSAFFTPIQFSGIPCQITNNVYSIGMHNKNNTYPFTTIEAAVQNSKYFIDTYALT